MTSTGTPQEPDPQQSPSPGASSQAANASAPPADPAATDVPASSAPSQRAGEPEAADGGASTGSPDGASEREEEQRGRPWGWITVVGILAAAALGLGIWAIQLNSDLDDANTTVATQEQQITEAQESGGELVQSAKQAFDDLSNELGATRADLKSTQAELDDATESADQAAQQAAQATDETEQLQAELDGAEAKAQGAAACTKSVVAALGGIFDGETLQAGVEAAAADVQALQPECGAALSE
jgi:hypothetical protein